MEKANCQNACSQKIYAKLLNNLLTNSRCKKGIYGSDQCENIGFLAQAGNNLKYQSENQLSPGIFTEINV